MGKTGRAIWVAAALAVVAMFLISMCAGRFPLSLPQIGEALLSKQESDNKKLEEQREADREEVRRIVENDPSEQ